MNNQKPSLLCQVRVAIRTKGYGICTEQACVDSIRRYMLFHQKRHPLEMGKAEIIDLS
ncbi:MAG: phage integrase N-terminal SAM-like domain-containing protein [Candidatus Thiodiazotropha sp.]